MENYISLLFAHRACFTHNAMSKVFCGHITRSGTPENLIVDTNIINCSYSVENYINLMFDLIFLMQKINSLRTTFFLTWTPFQIPGTASDLVVNSDYLCV